MRSAFLFGVLSLLAFVVVGCATITKGSTQTISITSNIDGARLSLDGIEIGVTPFTGSVPKNKTTLQVSKDGYAPSTIVLSKTLEGMFWGNIITGGTLGSITDFASGAAYSYAPATYHVELKASDQGALEFETQLVVRKFAMVYMDEISTDLATDGGDHLNALITLIQRSSPDIASEDVRRAFQESEGNQLTFGDGVVRLL